VYLRRVRLDTLLMAETLALGVMHPYRTADRRAGEAGRRHNSSRSDDRILGALLALLGGGRVVVAFATGEDLGAEATIAAILLVLGFAMLVFARSEVG
jgi:hypothetical protein